MAVISNEIDEDQGGAFTFTSGVVNELRHAGGSAHRFSVWPLRRLEKPSIPRRIADRLLRSLPDSDARNRQRAADEIDARVISERVGLVWFLNAAAPVTAAPYFATVWDLQHRLQPWFPEVRSSGWTWSDREAYYSATLPRASHIIVGTNEGRRQVELFYRVEPTNISVIPFFCPEERPSDIEASGDMPSELRALGSRRFFFYPAQFWAHKNHTLLLEAFAQVRSHESSDLALVLVGSDKGNVDTVKEFANRLGILDSVLFLGFVPRSTVIYCYRNAVALCFPTLFGPDNLPPLEAFSHGCPVLTSDVPGSDEQLGDAAIRLSPTSTRAWEEAMSKMLHDNDAREELKRRGLSRVTGSTAASYVAQVVDIIDLYAARRRTWALE